MSAHGAPRDVAGRGGRPAGRSPAGRERVVMVALFVIGVALMAPFENAVTLTLGVVFLFAFVAFGVLVIAGPGGSALADDDDTSHDSFPASDP